MGEKLYIKVNKDRIYGYTDMLAKRKDAVVMTQSDVDAWRKNKQDPAPAPAEEEKPKRKRRTSRTKPRTVASDVSIDPDEILKAMGTDDENVSGSGDEGAANPSG